MDTLSTSTVQSLVQLHEIGTKNPSLILHGFGSNGFGSCWGVRQGLHTGFEVQNFLDQVLRLKKMILLSRIIHMEGLQLGTKLTQRISKLGLGSRQIPHLIHEFLDAISQSVTQCAMEPIRSFLVKLLKFIAYI